jgi:hypothetical protein
MAAPEGSKPPPSQWKSFSSRLGKRIGDLVIEFLSTFVAIAGIRRFTSKMVDGGEQDVFWDHPGTMGL